jgi:hypothetical protein
MHLLFVALAAALQYKGIHHTANLAGRLQNGKLPDPHALTILLNWLMIGVVSLSAFGYVQWFVLRDHPWALLLPLTIAFTALFIWLYWKKGLRYVVERTEGRNYDLCRGN